MVGVEEETIDWGEIYKGLITALHEGPYGARKCTTKRAHLAAVFYFADHGGFLNGVLFVVRSFESKNTWLLYCRYGMEACLCVAGYGGDTQRFVFKC